MSVFPNSCMSCISTMKAPIAPYSWEPRVLIQDMDLNFHPARAEGVASCHLFVVDNSKHSFLSLGLACVSNKNRLYGLLLCCHAFLYFFGLPLDSITLLTAQVGFIKVFSVACLFLIQSFRCSG